MKALLFATLATAALLTATSVFAAPSTQGPGNRTRTDTYGYAQAPRAIPQAQPRWEGPPRQASYHNDKFDRYDRPDNYGYGYVQNHRRSPREHPHWQADYYNHR